MTPVGISPAAISRLAPTPLPTKPWNAPACRKVGLISNKGNGGEGAGPPPPSGLVQGTHSNGPGGHSRADCAETAEPNTARGNKRTNFIRSAFQWLGEGRRIDLNHLDQSKRCSPISLTQRPYRLDQPRAGFCRRPSIRGHPVR